MRLSQITHNLLLMTLLSTAPYLALEQPVSAKIDHLLRAEWKQKHIAAAPRCSDAVFLRRIWLDIVGVIPPPEAVKSFLADKCVDKRQQAVQQLLSDPRYSERWASYWDNLLMGRQLRNPIVDRVAFRSWLQEQFSANRGYDQLVRNLLTATGRNSPGGSASRNQGMNLPDPSPSASMPEMNAMQAAAQTPNNSLTPINGAVNWMLKYQQNSADLTGQVTRTFLGVQLQCAQCHDHKTEKWKQEDFRRMAACFVETRALPQGDPKARGMVRVVDLVDTRRPARGRKDPNRKDYASAIPAAFDGTSFTDSPNRRTALASWVTAPTNPWFAPAIVNRMWGCLLGRGFVDPVDDFRKSNPPVLPQALALLSTDFQAHHYDLKHLITVITSTQAYQLSSEGVQAGGGEIRLWSRFRLRALEPEILLNSMNSATNLSTVLQNIAGDRLPRLQYAMQQQFGFLFDVDEEFEQKEFEGTIPQALLLLNGSMTNRSVRPIPGTALAAIIAEHASDTERLNALCLRTLSRPPTTNEKTRWLKYLESASPQPQEAPILQRNVRGKQNLRSRSNDPLNGIEARLDRMTPLHNQQGLEDIFWAMLNSSEFSFNH